MAIRKIDCLSELCPIPLLRAIQELRTMDSDDILIVQADHSCVNVEIEKWAKKKGYPINSMDIGGGEWEVYIQKPKEK